MEADSVRAGLAVATLALLVALGGCGGGSEQPNAAGSAESLWAARAPYVGDNSRMAALVNETDLAAAGGYTLELGTARRPYTLTVALDEPFDADDVRRQATLLLGLVGNLDEVLITAGQDDYSLTAAVASQDLGYDVKQLGQDQPTLVRYLERASD